MLHVYVDGSWKPSSPKVSGWAFIVLNDDDQVLKYDSGVVLCKSRQIDGELYATLKALECVSKMKFSKIKLYYDYLGIEKWAKGIWKAKSLVAIEYVNRLKDLDKILQEVIFVKVKSHSGENVWNDAVDEIAKMAVDKY